MTTPPRILIKSQDAHATLLDLDRLQCVELRLPDGAGGERRLDLTELIAVHAAAPTDLACA